MCLLVRVRIKSVLQLMEQSVIDGNQLLIADLPMEVVQSVSTGGASEPESARSQASDAS